MEAVAGVYVQHVGIEVRDVEKIIKCFSVHSDLPEPIRTAHLIASGVTLGESRHRP